MIPPDCCRIMLNRSLSTLFGLLTNFPVSDPDKTPISFGSLGMLFFFSGWPWDSPSGAFCIGVFAQKLTLVFG